MNADTAWQEWLDDNPTIRFAFPLEDGGYELNLAFLAGYSRALQDAADEGTEQPMSAELTDAEEAEPNVYGEGNNTQPDFNTLLDSWEAEIDEHSKVGEYGIAEGLRVAFDELTALIRAAVGVTGDTGDNDE